MPAPLAEGRTLGAVWLQRWASATWRLAQWPSSTAWRFAGLATFVVVAAAAVLVIRPDRATIVSAIQEAGPLAPLVSPACASSHSPG